MRLSRPCLAAALVAALTCSITPRLSADPTPLLNPIPFDIQVGDVRVNLVPVAEGMVMPLWAVSPGDGSDRLFVIDQVGVVYLIKKGKLVDRPVLDLRKQIVKIKPNFDERGLLGIAFHPNFAKSGPGNGRVYLYTSEPTSSGKSDFPLKDAQNIDHHSVVTEWRFHSSNPDVIDPSSRREIMRFDQPQFNHDGGAIAFGPDGMLYIGVGDGGKAHDKGDGHSPGGNGQDRMKVLGKILRIDPLGRSGKKAANGQYSVPADNPFVGEPTWLPEIWASGMRNPFRMSFDRKDGTFTTGDIGQNMIEEINIIVRGGNYGWPIKEGTFYFDRRQGKEGSIYIKPLTKAELPKMIDPVIQYDHDDGISVIGGFVYRGSAIPKLVGQYVFGEWTRKSGKKLGRLLYADLKTAKAYEILQANGKPAGRYVTGFGEDDNGELYLLSSDSVGPKGKTGMVFKIMPVK